MFYKCLLWWILCLEWFRDFQNFQSFCSVFYYSFQKNLRGLVVLFQSKTSCASKDIGSGLYWEHLCIWIVFQCWNKKFKISIKIIWFKQTLFHIIKTLLGNHKHQINAALKSITFIKCLLKFLSFSMYKPFHPFLEYISPILVLTTLEPLTETS